MNDALKKLLAAYVDGELAPRERDVADQALRQSEAARKLLDALRKDAENLHKLPVVSPPAHLNDSIRNRLRIHERRQRALRGQRLRVGYALAASVLVAAGAAITWLAINGNPFQNEVVVAPTATNPAHALPSPLDPKKPDVAGGNRTDAQRTRDQIAALQRIGETLWGQVASAVENGTKSLNAAALAVGDLAKRRAGDTDARLTSPPKNPGSAFKTVGDRAFAEGLALVVNLRSLSEEALTDRLQPRGVYQLDIATTDTAKVFDRLRAACERSHIKLLLEPDLVTRLNRKVPTSCMIFLESQTPDNVLRLLSALDQEDRKYNDTLLQDILLFALSDDAKVRLAENLGVSAASLTPRPPVGARSLDDIDQTKSLSEETMKSLNHRAAEQAAKGRPGDAPGVAVVYHSNRRQFPLKDDVRKHLDKRPEPVPGSISLLIFLRLGQ